MHKIDNYSGALERLTRITLEGDGLLRLARGWQATYLLTAARYNRPRSLLICTAAVMAFTSTILALLVEPPGNHEETPRDALFYAVIILPALLVVVQNIESFWHTSDAANAAQRAAGLVAMQSYHYRTCGPRSLGRRVWE